MSTRRFLRADKYDVKNAYKRYSLACQMRDAIQLLQAYEKIEVEEFEKARVLVTKDLALFRKVGQLISLKYPRWSGRRDKRGLPICLFNITKLDSNTIAEYQAARSATTSLSSSALMRALLFHEYLTRFILPLCSAIVKGPEPAKPINSCLYLVDGVGIQPEASMEFEESYL